MIRAVLVFTFVLFSGSPSLAISQTAETEKLKTSNNDLRREKKIFFIKNSKIQKNNVALLETGDNQYMYESMGGKERRKVSGKFAKEADGLFVSHFIDLKYGMDKKNKNCSDYTTLFFRGESEKICSGDQERMKKVVAIYDQLQRKLKAE